MQICSIYGIDEVWLGHERSADVGNGVQWRGREVNHQYDKSGAFLARTRAYLSDTAAETCQASSGSGGSGTTCSDSSNSSGSSSTTSTSGGSNMNNECRPTSAQSIVIKSALANMWEIQVSLCD